MNENIERVLAELDGFRMADEMTYSAYSRLHDLISELDDLLKAQEPKPPRFAVTFDKIFYACDKCGKSLLVVVNAEGIKSLDNMPKYCPECGQAPKEEIV